MDNYKLEKIYHKEPVYLDTDVFDKPLLYWYDAKIPSTEIYSEVDFIIGSKNKLTYTMEDLKRLNVKDFIIQGI
jgi:hypothetical protein